MLTQDLDMRKVCAKIIPKILTAEKKAYRRDVCLDLLDRLLREPDMNHESWSTTPRKKNPAVGSGTLQTLSVPGNRE